MPTVPYRGAFTGTMRVVLVPPSTSVQVVTELEVLNLDTAACTLTLSIWTGRTTDYAHDRVADIDAGGAYFLEGRWALGPGESLVGSLAAFHTTTRPNWRATVETY